MSACMPWKFSLIAAAAAGVIFLSFVFRPAFADTRVSALAAVAEEPCAPASSSAAESTAAKSLPLPAKKIWFKNFLKVILFCIIIIFFIMFVFSLRRSLRFYKKRLGLGKPTYTQYIDAWKQYRLDKIPPPDDDSSESPGPPS